MKKIISINCIFGSHAFFVYLALIGYKYTGFENSKIYIIYTVFTAIAGLFLFFFDMLMKHRKIKIYLMFIPVLVCEIYLFTVLFANVSDSATKFFVYFLLWSLPAFFIGIYFAWNHRYDYLFKSLDLVMILGTVAIMLNTVINVIEGNYSQGIGGETNQTLSYVSAFVFGLNLNLNFASTDIERYKYTKSRLYRLICAILLPMQLLSVVIAGGRGGMVLSLVYTFLYLVKLIKSNQHTKLVLFMFAILVAGVISSFVIQNEIVKSGFNRAFSFIDSNGINWQDTSNRDVVYEKAIELIKESPLWGYGLFGYLSYYDNPHNLILEVLLNGGILYLIIFILVFMAIMKRYFNILKINKNILFIGLIATFPIVMLMFSGTYMVFSELWFALGFILSYRKEYL